ncbi:hypothetical protein [Nocardioides ultimimeridianus]
MNTINPEGGGQVDATRQTTMQANGRPDLAWRNRARSGASGGSVSLEEQLAALALDAATRSRFRVDVIHIASETL